MSVQHVMAIHQLVIEELQSGPRWWKPKSKSFFLDSVYTNLQSHGTQDRDANSLNRLEITTDCMLVMSAVKGIACLFSTGKSLALSASAVL